MLINYKENKAITIEVYRVLNALYRAFLQISPFRAGGERYNHEKEPEVYNGLNATQLRVRFTGFLKDSWTLQP